MRQVFAAFLVVLFPLSLTQAQDKPMSQADIAAYVNHMMDVQVAFEQMVPVGTSIEAKEYARAGKSGKDLVVQYHIFVKGIPEGTTIRAIQWPVNQDIPSVLMEGVSVGKDGIFMCAGRRPDQCGNPKKPDDPIEFTSIPAKGEPTRLAFIAGDTKIGIVLQPDPVEAKDKGCTLNALRLTSRFELAFISGSGYPANSDIHYKFSATTSKEDVIKSDANGVIRISMITGAKTKGVAKFKVNEPKCSAEVSFDYGGQ